MQGNTIPIGQVNKNSQKLDFDSSIDDASSILFKTLNYNFKLN